MSQCQANHEQMIAHASPVTACKASKEREGQKYTEGEFTSEATSDIETLCNALPESEQCKEICELHMTH